MDDATARRLLTGGNHRERLEAARFLLGRVAWADRHLITTAARKEHDQYVRAALLRLLISIPAEETGSAPREAASKRGDAPRDLRSQIIRELTDQLTHEFATVIGTLRHYATREVSNYEDSETKRELERLDAVLKATRQLGDAASAPQWEAIELDRFIRGVVQDERLVHGYELLMTEGPEQHSVMAAQGLIALFLRNAISNAIEATLELHEEPRPVVVTWGTDDREHWIAVIDEGAGVTGMVDALAEIGVSTKDGHPGMGLSIAHEVATSLGGGLTLLPQARGGTVCRLTWSRIDAAR